MKPEYIYVAWRVEDLPIAFLPAVKRKCSKCDKDVWVTGVTYHLSQISKIICTHCVQEL